MISFSNAMFAQIHKEMLEIDYDRSGTIEFQEFVMLMKKASKPKSSEPK